MYVYVYHHENNVHSRLSPLWLCDNSCILAYDVRLHIASNNEPKSLQQTSKTCSRDVQYCPDDQCSPDNCRNTRNLSL